MVVNSNSWVKHFPKVQLSLSETEQADFFTNSASKGGLEIVVPSLYYDFMQVQQKAVFAGKCGIFKAAERIPQHPSINKQACLLLSESCYYFFFYFQNTYIQYNLFIEYISASLQQLIGNNNFVRFK
ncbi:Hypothetical_protein [Hexamita inflata]|uniref:Hypothetical_protein n=1 Tax=Hexamita inflata TaxID=28002 RepID=A0AA86U9L4_9EUKA|nr:Hypothetical protein HINF_LOCUS30377 [Hexamita inflata]